MKKTRLIRKKDLPNICGRLKGARMARGMTQRQLAEILGVSESTISNLENHHRWPSNTAAMEKLAFEAAEYFGIMLF